MRSEETTKHTNNTKKENKESYDPALSERYARTSILFFVCLFFVLFVCFVVSKLSPWEPVTLDQHLGDLHRVGRGALAEVVGDDPQVQAVGDRRVAADAPDEDLVAALGAQGQGHLAPGVVIDEDDSRRLAKGLPRLLDADGLVELEVDQI